MKKIITLLSLLFICIASFAQKQIPPPDEITLQNYATKVIKPSAFIFEGKIISQKPYYEKRNGTYHGFTYLDLYTYYVIQINKVFRGDSRLKYESTVSFKIKIGGSYIDYSIHPKGDTIQSMLIEDGQTSFSNEGVFICNLDTTSLMNSRNISDTSMRVSFYDNLNFYEGGIVGKYSQAFNFKFSSKQEFYLFLSNRII